MTREQSTAAIVVTVAAVGIALFMQQQPPKELDAIERSQIYIDCVEEATSALVGGYIKSDQTDSYISYCEQKDIAEALR